MQRLSKLLKLFDGDLVGRWREISVAGAQWRWLGSNLLDGGGEADGGNVLLWFLVGGGRIGGILRCLRHCKTIYISHCSCNTRYVVETRGAVDACGRGRHGGAFTLRLGRTGKMERTGGLDLEALLVASRCGRVHEELRMAANLGRRPSSDGEGRIEGRRVWGEGEVDRARWEGSPAGQESRLKKLRDDASTSVKSGR